MSQHAKRYRKRRPIGKANERTNVAYISRHAHTPHTHPCKRQLPQPPAEFSDSMTLPLPPPRRYSTALDESHRTTASAVVTSTTPPGAMAAVIDAADRAELSLLLANASVTAASSLTTAVAALVSGVAEGDSGSASGAVRNSASLTDTVAGNTAKPPSDLHRSPPSLASTIDFCF